ncbi:MAG: hypothetical protein LBB23_01385 [Rickettsiales bacterium]|jgi:opacity protein-like surface antigen|nr:hypothetical protein [Rickettsiales bacterium]
MKKLAIIAAVAAMSAPVAANALITPYAGVNVGLAGSAFFNKSISSIDTNSFGAQVGIGFPFIRGELEYNYVIGDDTAANLGFINVYLEPMPFLPIFTPYVGGGVGQAFGVKINDVKFGSAAAYQAMVGTGVSIKGFPIKFDGELRVMGTQRLESDVRMGMFDVRVKASYKF